MKIVKAFPLLAMGVLSLGLVGATVLAPVVNAEEAKSTASQTVSVDIKPTLSFSLSQSDVTATPDGALSSTTTGTIGSNLLKGYTVTIEDNSGNADMLLNGNSAASVIPAVDNATTISKGWSAFYGGAHHKVMPKGQGQQVTKTDQPGGGTFTVQYAAKADNSVANGTYKTTVLYTVSPNQVN